MKKLFAFLFIGLIASMPATAKECHSYRDCNAGEYCHFYPSGCTDQDAPTVGVCQSLSECGESKPYTANDGKIFWGGTCRQDWWTSQDICEAKGMSMVSLSDLKCTVYAPKWHCTGDYAVTIGQYLDEDDFWTIDLENSCKAFYVLPADGMPGGMFLNSRHFRRAVLCRSN